MSTRDFAARYGQWAVVAGASEGIGAAFAVELAARGLKLILAARRAGRLDELAATLPTEVVAVAADLSTLDGLSAVAEVAGEREVGLVVCNAALSPIGSFIEQDPAQTQTALDLNCRAPLWLAHRFLPPMAGRRRGGFIIMSSLAGQQGSPPLTVYAATKAFGAVLAEGLWAELRGSGVDVVTCVAGAVSTPGLAQSKSKPAPGTVTPDTVVQATLKRLRRGPRVVPGSLMRVSSVVMSRLPRRTAIGIISRASRDLTPPS
jgi:short-subunit dehydrogenase